MKATSIVGLLVMTGIQVFRVCIAEEESKSAIEPQDTCAHQLRVLRQAIYAYEKANETYPETLEDLVPDYLGSSDNFICPEAKKLGDTTSGSVQVRDYSGAGVSYEYQFLLDSWSEITDLRGGKHKTTMRQFKLMQAKALGDVVPCIRCFHHGPHTVRNMSVGGRIYVSGQYWESAFVDRMTLPYSMEGVMMDQRPIQERLPQRDNRLSDESLDLSSSYNGLLTDRWLGGSRVVESGSIKPGTILSDGIRFDARGVIQLQGKGMLLVKFPSRREVEIERSGGKIHVLHGSFFKGENGEKVASYKIHLEEGESIEFPIMFGEQIWYSEVPDQTELPKGLTAITHGSSTFMLYHTSFEVPGGSELRSIEVVTGESDVAPFLLGVTVE